MSAHRNEGGSIGLHQGSIRGEAARVKPLLPMGLTTLHHKKMVATGLITLSNFGIRLPDGEQVLTANPIFDEVMVVVPGRQGKHPFPRVVSNQFDDCYFVIGYTPSIKTVFGEPGALMVVRRLAERPTNEDWVHLISIEWGGLVP